MTNDTNGVLRAAYDAWTAAADFRSRRERHKRYTYGDQWCDCVAGEGNRPMREDSAIILSGKRPVTNNMIRQLVKTIVGRYRTMQTDAKPHGALARAYRANFLPDMDSRLLEEFLISGCAVQRIATDEATAGCPRVDNVDPRRFFVNRLTDPRGWDAELLGMLHDLTLPDVLRRFGRGSRAREARIMRIYADTAGARAYSAPVAFGAVSSAGQAFFTPSAGRCRVVEVWTLDCRRPEPGKPFDFVWRCRWIAPDGTVLDEYDSPFAHRSHPFAMKFYPLTDGEVHPFVEDVIDTQRYINRLLVMIDHIMASSAKGVLLFPLGQLPKGVDMDYVSRRWAQSDGVIPITGDGQHLPQQVVTHSSDSSAYQLLQLQMKLFRDASGVSDALMGQAPGGSEGVAMYESRIRNATIALADLLETFGSFVEARNEKILLTTNESIQP